MQKFRNKYTRQCHTCQKNQPNKIWEARFILSAYNQMPGVDTGLQLGLKNCRRVWIFTSLWVLVELQSIPAFSQLQTPTSCPASTSIQRVLQQINPSMQANIMWSCKASYNPWQGFAKYHRERLWNPESMVKESSCLFQNWSQGEVKERLNTV